MRSFLRSFLVSGSGMGGGGGSAGGSIGTGCSMRWERPSSTVLAARAPPGGPAYAVALRSGRSHHSAPGTSANRRSSVLDDTAVGPLLPPAAPAASPAAPSAAARAAAAIAVAAALRLADGLFASASIISTAALARRSSPFREKCPSATKAKARFLRWSRPWPGMAMRGS